MHHLLHIKLNVDNPLLALYDCENYSGCHGQQMASGTSMIYRRVRLWFHSIPFPFYYLSSPTTQAYTNKASSADASTSPTPSTRPTACSIAADVISGGSDE